tara:strand:+ start:1112 stop:1222 length:111 start_codon:yes stop_codon:yes gene_type:complete
VAISPKYYHGAWGHEGGIFAFINLLSGAWGHEHDYI